MSSPATSPTGRASSRPGRLLAAVLAGAAALTVAACGSDEPREEPEATPGAGEVIDISGTDPVGVETAGSVAQLVECRDWNAATSEQRLATIEDVRSQLSRTDTGIESPALTDDEATELFDSACSPEWAQGFRLYKLYARAAGFVPLKRALED